MKEKRYLVKFEYEINEDDLAEFVNRIVPFANNLNIKEFWERHHNKNRDIRNKSSLNRESNTQNDVRDILSPDNKLSTNDIFKKLQRKRYFCYNYRTFSRLLTRMAILNILSVKKVEKDKGGYKNVWWLK